MADVMETFGLYLILALVATLWCVANADSGRDWAITFAIALTAPHWGPWLT